MSIYLGLNTSNGRPTPLTSDEALRKHGILPPREPTPQSPSPPPSPTLDDILEDLTAAELQELGEDVQDDAIERQIAQRPSAATRRRTSRCAAQAFWQSHPDREG